MPESELDQRLAKLLSWVVRDYANSGPLRLPSGVPEGKNARGQSSVRLATLQHTYWLQDNALYMAAAFEQYAPVLGRDLSDSWRSKWQQYFPSLCPDTQSDYVIGQLPEYDTASTVADPRCRLPRPDAWQFFRMHQYPDPADPQFDTRPGPIIGTDHPVDVQEHSEIVPITRKSPRNLLKYGCLRQALLGNHAVAQQMFDLALKQWDGSGFIIGKNDPQTGGRLAGMYWTRDLAFALLCAAALDKGQQPAWGEHGQVSKAAIESRLWGAQSASGGIWTVYCGDKADGRRWCGDDNKVPGFAKQSNEIAPLVLLAYGRDLWQPRH